MVNELKVGDFKVRPATAEILGPEGVVRVEPKSMAVLVDFARHPGAVRSRKEILDAVWADTFVGEEALTHCVWELRRAFGDDARKPRYIQTLARRGYRLLADVVRLGVPSVTTVLAVMSGTEEGGGADEGASMVSAFIEGGLESDGAVAVNDGMFLLDRPSSAVQLALDCQHMAASTTPGKVLRFGIHVGEAALRTEPDAADASLSHWADGPACEIAARLRRLARPQQILMSRGTFDLAREGNPMAWAEADETGEPLEPRWLAHGAYYFKEIEHPVQVYEVGVRGVAPLDTPPDTSGARREQGDSTIVGWRPATGQMIPGRRTWRLTRRLGEGGFGEAWLAHQMKTAEPRVFKFCHERNRLAALKREVTIFRLLKESLGHREDITRLLDWRFDETPFYIESEYSGAGDLIEWADEEGGVEAVDLGIRLEVVTQCAGALAAAHSVGVLHKDVKPANILIQPAADGSPQARLTDFGIGHVVDRRFLEDVEVTQLGLTESAWNDDSSGTPLYRAPEVLEGKPATLQADVYALGVVLYQLVVGDLGRALAPGWEREIDDELLREDIALAVDGDPSRRLGDAGQLADRLQRLHERRHERVGQLQERQALEGAREVLRRAKARRRMGAAIVAFLLVFAGAMAYQARRVAEEAQRAADQAEVSRQVTGFLEDLFKVSNPNQNPGGEITARELLDLGAKKIVDELDEQPQVQAALMHSMGGAYAGLGLYEPAEDLLGQALVIRRETLPSGTPELTETQQDLGIVLQAGGRFADSEALYREVLEARRSRLGAVHSDVAETLNNLGLVQWKQGKYEAATASLQEALEIRRVLPEVELADIAKNLNGLGLVQWEQGDLEAAETSFLETLALRRRAQGEAHPQVGVTLNNLALVQRAQGNYAEAEIWFREALDHFRTNLGDEHPYVAIGLTNLARAHLAQENLDAAEARCEEGLVIKRKVYGERHPSLANSIEILGKVALHRGALALAETHQRAALQLRLDVLDSGHPRVAASRQALGEVLVRKGRASEAEPLLQSAVEGLAAALPADHPRLAGARLDLADALVALGEHDAASSWVELALKALADAPADDPLRQRAAAHEARVGSTVGSVEP